MSHIAQQTKDPLANIILDTLGRKKQALVFVNTKPSAEKTAEELSKKIKETNPELEMLSEKVLKALSSPTKQCRRLAECVKKGIAFHHAGLTHKQRELIEDNFRLGTIKVIASTPTLAAGLDLPAFRAIVRDLKRYGQRGMQPIPVLEYLQMAGRAGRPSYDEYGEAICIASTEAEKEAIFETYVLGEPEDIYSKLAVEPVLRTYLLSLIASEVVRTEEQIIDFFSKTFWAFQFKDMNVLKEKILSMLHTLEQWKFLESSEVSSDFVSADEISGYKYKATQLGKRTAELYLDPLTADMILKALGRGKGRDVKDIALLQMVCNTLEMRPLLRVRTKEYDSIQEKYMPYALEMLQPEPSVYEPEHDSYMDSIKTALMLKEWISEMSEEYILENYNARPGELRAKIDIGDWLLYASEEFAKMQSQHDMIKEIKKLRLRLKHGAREELLALLQLKDIGRVRARKLFNNSIKDIADVKKTDIGMIAHLIGAGAARSVKEQVGEKVDPEKIKISERKRKGQMSLAKYN